MGIGIVVDEVIGHRIHHGAGDLGPAGPVEIGHGMTCATARVRGSPRGSRRSTRSKVPECWSLGGVMGAPRETFGGSHGDFSEFSRLALASSCRLSEDGPLES